MRRSFRVNGTLSDTLLMAIRRDEWEAGKEGPALAHSGLAQQGGNLRRRVGHPDAGRHQGLPL
jgi:hypothetical protein